MTSNNADQSDHNDAGETVASSSTDVVVYEGADGSRLLPVVIPPGPRNISPFIAKSVRTIPRRKFRRTVLLRKKTDSGKRRGKVVLAVHHEPVEPIVFEAGTYPDTGHKRLTLIPIDSYDPGLRPEDQERRIDLSVERGAKRPPGFAYDHFVRNYGIASLLPAYNKVCKELPNSADRRSWISYPGNRRSKAEDAKFGLMLCFSALASQVPLYKLFFKQRAIEVKSIDINLVNLDRVTLSPSERYAIERQMAELKKNAKITRQEIDRRNERREELGRLSAKLGSP